MNPHRHLTRARSLLGGSLLLAASAASAASAGLRDTALTIAPGAGSYDAAPTCFSETRTTVRYFADGSLHLDAVAADATATVAGVATWDDSGECFVAWHCLVTARADGRWSGRAAVVANGSTIGSGVGDRRVCRYLGTGAGAIDANIAHPGEYADVAAPSSRRISWSCRAARAGRAFRRRSSISREPDHPRQDRVVAPCLSCRP
jgi:hypothetical protein